MVFMQLLIYLLDDIAELVFFSAGRRENVVIAYVLVYPNHQVRYSHRLGTLLLLL